MKRKSFIMSGRRVALAACAVVVGAGTLTSCKDEILSGQPEWLGNSIYERLQDGGNYTTVLKLIDDLDQKDVLAHTGSKTLFVADDQTFQEWFRKNDWGVSSYNQLSKAQKRLLLNNAMINNAYLIELMSNVKAQTDGGTPVEGAAMRRETACTIYDSVYIMPVKDFPATSGWSEVRERGKAIPLMRDNSAPPMIHFLPAFMRSNSITDDDLKFLTNGVATSIAEAWVNGKRVVERDITCKNGYLQKVDGVIENSTNMAEIIHDHANMSMWANLLDRFSAPYYNETCTKDYNRLYETTDSVYVLKYYSDRSSEHLDKNNRPTNVLDTDPQGNSVKNLLKFDPGWNQYIDAQEGTDLHYDAGVMIVPTNTALEAWWNGDGRDLQDEYQSWDRLPDDILIELMRVNQLPNLTNAVPSKFDNVLNDAREPLGITVADIDSCFMGSNGMVYLSNKVFAPASFSAVYYPALAHQSTMNIIYWALMGGLNSSNFPFNYKPYLLSLDSKYALMLPTNDAMKLYVDPYSYGGTASLIGEEGDTTLVTNIDLVEFDYDLSKPRSEYVQAKSTKANVNPDGSFTKVGDRSTDLGTNLVRNLLETLIDQLIIVIPDPNKTMTIDDYVDKEGRQYFLTKSGSTVRITRSPSGNLQFEGGWQMEGHGQPIEVVDRYEKVNGVSYQLEAGLPLPSSRTFDITTKDVPEFEAFVNLAHFSELFSKSIRISDSESYQAGNNKQSSNMVLFDNYNYTVYIPRNETVVDLQNRKILPTLEELDIEWSQASVIDSLLKAEGWYPEKTLTGDLMKEYRKKAKDLVLGVAADFVRYHVQDHSVAIGMASASYDVNYESMKRNPDTKRYYTLGVKFDNTSLTVTDELGVEHHVVTTPNLYNQMCRDYWFNGKETRMYSDVIVHLIDTPLKYQKDRPWRDIVREGLDKWLTEQGLK